MATLLSQSLSAAMTAQHECSKQQSTRSSSSVTASHEQQQPTDTNSPAQVLAPATAFRRAKAMRRSTKVATSLVSESETQQSEHWQLARSARKRLSLPFRRSSQVFTSTITDIDIYYGSLTGTAARLAAELARDIAARGVNTTLQSLEHFSERTFVASGKLTHTHAAVFVVATHFAGSAPPSAEAFYEWLRAASSPPPTSNERSAAAQEQAVTASETTTATAQVPFDHGHGSSATSDTSVDSIAATSMNASRLCANTRAPVVTASATSSVVATGSSPLRFLLRWSRRKRPERSRGRLDGLQYAVFGVGSSVYLTYNAMGKFVDARLSILGGARLCSLGLGDVSDNIDAAFTRWKSALLYQLPIVPHNIRVLAFENDTLLMELPEKESARQLSQPRRSGSFNRMQQYRQDELSPLPPACAFKIRDPLLSKAARSVVVDQPNKSVRLRFRCRAVLKTVAVMRRSSGLANYSTQASIAPDPSVAPTKHALHTRRPTASLQSISILRPSADSAQQAAAEATDPVDGTSQVVLIRVALMDDDLTFECGDAFSYLPHNSIETVERVAAHLDFDLDTWIELYTEPLREQLCRSERTQLPFATPCTVRTVLAEFLELNSVSREFLRVAAGFVSNDSERDALEQLASIDGSAAFAEQFAQQHRGIVALLELAPSLKIPFEVFVNITPLIKPRLYSIASSHLSHAHQFELAVNIGRPSDPQGLSVTYLRRVMADLQRKSASSVLVRACITRSAFKAPIDIAAPMVLIANGVGIAPMRALLVHRKLEFNRLQEDSEAPETPPRNLLFYGCKSAASILFADELRALERDGFVALQFAFSGSNERSGVFVQDVVKAHLSAIVKTTSASSDAKIFVCGSAAMARSVRQVFQESASSASGDGVAQATWLDDMVQSGRFVQDVF